MSDTELEYLNNKKENNEIPNQIESILKDIIFDKEELENIKKKEKKIFCDTYSNIDEENIENGNNLCPFNFQEFTDDDLFNSTAGDEILNITQTQSNIDFFRTNENTKPQTMIMKNPFSIRNDNPFNYFFEDNIRTRSPTSTHKFNMKKSLNENNINLINSCNGNNNSMFFFPILNQINNIVPDNINININYQNNINIDNNQRYLRNNIRNNINRRTIMHRNNNCENLLNKNLIQDKDKIRFQTMKIKKSKNLSFQIESYLIELEKYLQYIGFINYNIFNNIKL